MSESEVKVIAIRAEAGVQLLMDRLKEVEERVIRMESWMEQIEHQVIRMQRSFDALGRRLEGSERHVEDEGWFD
jgi:hypothetical protein